MVPVIEPGPTGRSTASCLDAESQDVLSGGQSGQRGLRALVQIPPDPQQAVEPGAGLLVEHRGSVVVVAEEPGPRRLQAGRPPWIIAGFDRSRARIGEC